MDFSGITVLCIGDVMLDRFYYGDMERISPEAPVPVLLMKQKREMPGGAGNVANNVISLGGRAVLIGLSGEDEAGDILRQVLRGQSRVSDCLITTSRRPTISKTRFIASHQQVIRADEESREPLHDDEADRLCRMFDERIDSVQVVVLSDYGKGVCSERVIRHVTASCRERGIRIFADPKEPDFRHYLGATCITPNLKELAGASGMTGESDAAVEAAARKVMARAEASAILVTRSEKGMMLVPAGEPAVSIPARAREVFDVSGAGDTVIATMALASGAGIAMQDAMRIANAAAGVVVGKLGTATADISEVMDELAAQDTPEETQLLSWTQIRTQTDRWKARGLKVGFTNGCFDILHPGHIALLAAARKSCDRLVVGLNDDESVRRLKGADRPVNSLAARAEVMAAIRYVDAVVSFGEDTPFELISMLIPDVLIKGADYRPDQVVGADVVQAAGGRLVLANLKAGHSTTETIAQITKRAS